MFEVDAGYWMLDTGCLGVGVWVVISHPEWNLSRCNWDSKDVGNVV
jgi:hypothetical protein